MRVGAGVSGGVFFTEVGESLFNFPGNVVQYLFPSTLPPLPGSAETSPPAPATERMLEGGWSPDILYEVSAQERERALEQGRLGGGPVPPSWAETPWGTYALIGIGVLVAGAVIGGRRRR